MQYLTYTHYFDYFPGAYEFMLGLKTDQSQYTSEEVQGAIDEIQKVSVSSVYLPDIQVSEKCSTDFRFILEVK